MSAKFKLVFFLLLMVDFFMYFYQSLNIVERFTNR